MQASKRKKKEWNNNILSMFPSKELKEKTRQENKRIDNHMPKKSINNSWRVDLILTERL